MTRARASAIVLAGVVVYSTVNYIVVRRTEIKKREQIRAKLAADIRAIEIGTIRLQEKIMSGEYRPKSLHDLHERLEFEYIAAHYE